MGMPELIVIFIIALLVFGPKKLPELGKSLGRAMSEFKRSSQEFRDSLETEVETGKIKEELLKHQQEIKDSMNANAAPDEKKPETKEAPKTDA